MLTANSLISFLKCLEKQLVMLGVPKGMNHIEQVPYLIFP